MTTQHFQDIKHPVAGKTISDLTIRQLGSQAAQRPIEDIELIRHGTNAVFQDVSAQVVLRVSEPTPMAGIEDHFALLEHLSDAMASIVEPLDPGIAFNDDIMVTAWPLGAPTPTDIAGLGTALRTLHDARVSNTGLTTVNISDRFTRRLDGIADDLGVEIASVLHDKVQAATEIFDQFMAAAHGVIHGDAHAGNQVQLHGQPMLVDLDDIALGPREFDLLPTVVAATRMDRNGDRLSTFQKAYGQDIDWDAVDRLRIVRETTMNTWLADKSRKNPAARAQLEHRIATWDANPLSHEPWGPF
ncbi:MAG: phosphotransferase [Micrococcaceae bacterium]|nr:phosphotransferase [Micrococcaceae bacterium]